MADPLGLIGGIGGQSPLSRLNAKPSSSEGSQVAGSDFKDLLTRNLDEVNKAQQDASRAVEDLMTGDRADVEQVIDATRKADDAFRLLQALRNRVIEAYDEVKQMRV